MSGVCKAPPGFIVFSYPFLAQEAVCVVFFSFMWRCCLWHVTRTPTAHTFFSCAVCQRSCPSLLSQFVLQVVSHLVIDSTHTRGSRAHPLKRNMKLGTLCLAQKCSRHRAPCHASHPLTSGTPSLGTCTLSLTLIRLASTSSFPYDPLPGATQPCADLRQLERGSMVEGGPNFHKSRASAFCRKQASHRRHASCRKQASR